MSNGPTHGERYQQERAYARFARAQQGRTTALDRAEEHHEKLWKALLAARFFAPLGIVWTIALSGGSTLLDCWAIMMWMLGANFVAVISSAVAKSLFGSGFGELIYNVVMTLGGVILLFAPNPPPVMPPIAIVLTVAPTAWWVLSRVVMTNTSYVRLMRDMATDDVMPRIIE